MNQWVITIATLLVAGLLVAGLRGSLKGLLDELGERARLDSLTGLFCRSSKGWCASRGATWTHLHQEAEEVALKSAKYL